MTVTLSYAKGHWSEILTAVEGGQTVTITRAGKPIAYLSNKLPETIQADQVLRAAVAADDAASGLGGVLRPAPEAAKAFASRDERRAAIEISPESAPKPAQEAGSVTLTIPSTSEPKKTVHPVVVSVTQDGAVTITKTAERPARGLTLAEIMKAAD